MKPTPPPRLHWPVVGFALVGVAMLLWGCGHTREIVYPPRKVSPPRNLKARTTRPKLEAVDPTESVHPAEPNHRRPPDAPTTIDVPILDPNGS